MGMIVAHNHVHYSYMTMQQTTKEVGKQRKYSLSLGPTADEINGDLSLTYVGD